ncbi:hypothetical protein, partial [Kingella kingae]|uniref:hypothetical protein n=1 Tax=Kingella kingae TaxID=504 RepID=UPI00056F29A2
MNKSRYIGSQKSQSKTRNKHKLMGLILFDPPPQFGAFSFKIRTFTMKMKKIAVLFVSGCLK